MTASLKRVSSAQITTCYSRQSLSNRLHSLSLARQAVSSAERSLMTTKTGANSEASTKLARRQKRRMKRTWHRKPNRLPNWELLISKNQQSSFSADRILTLYKKRKYKSCPKPCSKSSNQTTSKRSHWSNLTFRCQSSACWIRWRQIANYSQAKCAIKVWGSCISGRVMSWILWVKCVAALLECPTSRTRMYCQVSISHQL